MRGLYSLCEAMKSTLPVIVFVYNADSTLAGAAGDFVTRIFSPKNYSCNLCMVTYGSFKMKTPWKKFLETIPNEKVFLHRDEFFKAYPRYKKASLPAVFIKKDNALEVLISTKEINAIKNWKELKILLISKLEHGEG